MECGKISKKSLKKAVTFKDYIFSKNFLRAVVLGQLLSLLICGTALTSGLLQEHDVHIPTGQSLLNYVLLALVYTPWSVARVGWRGWWSVVRQRGWWYVLLGVVEVEANFMIIKAYQLTSVTSVQLLDCLAIPTILLLSRRFLKATYVCGNYAGVLVCLIGAATLVLADVITDRYDERGRGGGGGAWRGIAGDLLCIGGSLLYGALNVAQEALVAKHGSVEYLSLVPLVASVVSSVQVSLLERHELASIDFSVTTIWLSLFLFTLCMFFFYSTLPYVINTTSAINANLNLLSSDVFSLVIGIFLFHYQFHWLHFVSFFLIIIGVIIYNVFSRKQSSSSPSSSPAFRPCDQDQSDVIFNPSSSLPIPSPTTTLPTSSSPTTTSPSSSPILKLVEPLPNVIVTSL